MSLPPLFIWSVIKGFPYGLGPWLDETLATFNCGGCR